MKSLKRNFSVENKEAANLPPIGDSFMHIETKSNNSGNGKVLVGFEGTDNKQISNNTFYYNRFSNQSSSLRSMGQYKKS